MIDSKEHAALDAAFQRDQEDFEMKELMKPSFDDFELKF